MQETVIFAAHRVAENAQLFKALGDETRLKMVGLLKYGELCVCDLMEVLGLPQSTASRHLSYLKNSQWVVGRRAGKWMYYRLHPGVEQDSTYRSLINYISELEEVQKEHTRLQYYLERKESGGSCK